jgi:hypothetical protein
LTTVQIDGSTPAIATQATGTTATVVSSAFVPPGGAVLAVRYSANTIDPNDPGTPTITDSLGTPLTYLTQDVSKRPDSPLAEGQAAAWIAVVPSGTTSMTITVTNGAASPNRHAALRVLVLTGVDQVTPVGQHGKSSSLSAASVAASYTATRAGSLGLLVVCDWFDAGAETAGGAGNTLEGSADIGGQFTYGFFRRTNPDGVLGATTTITATIPGTSTSLRWTWLEMLPGPDGAPPPRPLGLSAKMPPAMRMAAMRYQSLPDAAATTPIMPDAGTAQLAVVTAGTAVKVAPQSGSAVLFVRGTGTQIHAQAQAGRAIVPIRTTGTQSTTDTRAQSGACVLFVRAAGDGRKRAIEAGTGAVVLSAAGTAAKRAPQAGTAQVPVRATGTQIHAQAQAGRAFLLPRTSGAATNRTATQSGRAGLVVTGTGTAAKKAPQAGTANVAVTSAGLAASGTARAQSGGCVVFVQTGATARKTAILTGKTMVALTGAGSAVKRTPQAGAAVLAARATGTAVKRVAAAGKSSFITTPGGVAGKRVAATGRTILPLFTYGTQLVGAPPVPPVRLEDRLDDILNALISYVSRLGLFDKVQSHEPKSSPRNGLTAALWLQGMAPALGQSGLGSTSLRVTWFLRIYQNFLSVPQDAIDPKVMKACAGVMAALTANFDLDIPQIRNIDLLGMTGPPMQAEAGYLQVDRDIYRCMTLSIPIIVDDAFAQTA